ncbi:unnamed protein product [Heterosigma akashiwo]
MASGRDLYHVVLLTLGMGGAFPEIHVVQHPLNMGRPKKFTEHEPLPTPSTNMNVFFNQDPTKSSTAIVAVDVDEGGEVQYDAIIKQGRKDKKIFTKHDDLKEKTGDEAALSLPSTEEAAAAADATRAALARIIGAKVPGPLAGAQGGKKEEEPTFVRYTPNPAAPGYNPQAKQRVIRLVGAQVDPMEPPKHKHKKVPRGAPPPPAVPVLHSPPRKVTVADQQAWKIPPCVSNWKNARGYTIPLDKRLAADGRGLQEFSVNDQFATLSEALIIAERKARDQLALKQKLKQQLAAKEKERKEQDLRALAKKARMGALGLAVAAIAAAGRWRWSAAGRRRGEAGRVARASATDPLATASAWRKREMRLDNFKGEQEDGPRGQRTVEKIALGLNVGKQKLAGDQVFDSRLFNQSAGMDSGFGQDDDYNAYSKPLFDRGGAGNIYRPRATDGDSYGTAEEQYDKITKTDRFRPDKGFKGTEYAGGGGQERAAPVQFEKQAEELDPFGLDQFLTDAKKGKKKG